MFCWTSPVGTLNPLVEIDECESERVESLGDETTEETGFFVWLPPVNTLVEPVEVGDGEPGPVKPGLVEPGVAESGLVELLGSETVVGNGVGFSG